MYLCGVTRELIHPVHVETNQYVFDSAAGSQPSSLSQERQRYWNDQDAIVSSLSRIYINFLNTLTDSFHVKTCEEPRVLRYKLILLLSLLTFTPVRMASDGLTLNFHFVEQ